MPEDIPDKKTWRARLRRRLTAIDPEELHRRSHQAARLLTDTPSFRRAQAVMIFLPLPHEVDTTAVALRAWQEGKVVTVPLVSYEQKHMIPVEVRSLDEPMDTDHYGVRTPATGEPYPIELIDLVVVPGLGFDTSGYRIGRGSGFYDRFLAQPAFGGVTCGLALEEQVCEKLPTNGHDIRLDMIVTDRRVLRPRSDRR